MPKLRGQLLKRELCFAARQPGLCRILTAIRAVLPVLRHRGVPAEGQHPVECLAVVKEGRFLLDVLAKEGNILDYVLGC